VGKAKHVPQAHAGVLEHFSKLANAKEHEAMIAAELLNRARSARMTADYGGAEPPDEAEMRECVTDAREFIRLCCRYFDLPPFQLDA